MSLTTILTWVMIMLIFWLAVYMIGGWILVGGVMAVSVGGMAFILWRERLK